MTAAEFKIKPGTPRSQGGWKELGYLSWVEMKQRCLNTAHDAYYRYGGRGITIHTPWIFSYSEFSKDMGPRPSKQHTLDRINNNGNYEPGNCRWATKREQEWNKRQNVMLCIDGRTQCIMAWSLETIVPYATISYRIRRGWDHKKAVFQIPRTWK